MIILSQQYWGWVDEDFSINSVASKSNHINEKHLSVITICVKIGLMPSNQQRAWADSKLTFPWYTVVGAMSELSLRSCLLSHHSGNWARTYPEVMWPVVVVVYWWYVHIGDTLSVVEDLTTCRQHCHNIIVTPLYPPTVYNYTWRWHSVNSHNGYIAPTTVTMTPYNGTLSVEFQVGCGSHLCNWIKIYSKIDMKDQTI